MIQYEHQCFSVRYTEVITPTLAILEVAGGGDHSEVQEPNKLPQVVQEQVHLLEALP